LVLVFLARWMTADDRPDNLWAIKIQQLATSFSDRCPDTIGTRVAALADQARTAAGKVLKGVQPAIHRHIDEVPAADRLTIAGRGDTRILGVTVPAEQEAQALAYPRSAVAGKRLAVTVVAARDPEKRSLVVVAQEDGSHVNARLIQQGLARPWRIPSPWQGWPTGPSSSESPAARAAPGN
jgi:endonuclease YncB( thermonuclease family)